MYHNGNSHDQLASDSHNWNFTHNQDYYYLSGSHCHDRDSMVELESHQSGRDKWNNSAIPEFYNPSYSNHGESLLFRLSYYDFQQDSRRASVALGHHAASNYHSYRADYSFYSR